MSKAMIAAVTLGGAGLFVGSYIGFGAAVGAPLHELAVVGGLFPEPEGSVIIGGDEDEEPDPEPDPDMHRRKILEKLTAPKHTASIVDLVTVPAPYSTDELKTLVDELGDGIDRLELRERQAREREQEIERRQAKLDEDYATLIRLQQSMDDWASELRQREVDLNRATAVRDEKTREVRSRIGEAFLTGDPEELVPRLNLFEPAEAAGILITLPPKRANELLNALSDNASWKDYVEAYAAERAKQ